MAKRKRAIPQYGTVVLNGIEYYRTRVEDSDGNRVALYAKTPEKLYDKELEALEQIDSTTFRRRSPTVAEYCEKWLLMQSVHVRATTLTDYTSKVRRHIIGGLGDKRMADVSLDDIQLALVPVSKKSASVYKSVVILCKSIFRAAKESHVIDEDPTIYLDAKGGVPQEERQALTDEQVERLLDTIRDLPPYVFVMIGLYAGLRREEILALQWDSVYLDAEAPYLTVRRAWHTEHNRPVILTELKTKAAQRNIPLPVCLVECLKDAKKKSTSDYVIANRDGDPLSYTQFKRLWQYIVTRTAKPRMARKLVDGKYVKYIVAFLLLAKKIIIAVVVGEVGEIISCAAVSTQRLAVSDLLDISKTTGHALVSVGVESVESDRYPCIAAAVNFAAIKNRLNMSINDLGRSGAVGIDEEAVLVGLVITLNITVAERELDRSLVRLLAAELADAVLDSGIDCLVDGVNRLLVGLRDDQRNAVLFLAAVDGLRFPYICIRESYDTGYDFCRMIVNRHN